MLHEIYLITNLINNKKYVGQTKQGNTFHRFLKEHAYIREGDNTLFHNAIQKYGVENFSAIVIEDSIAEEDIDAREIFYIDFYHSFYKYRQGYNMTRGGRGLLGYEPTEEAKRKTKERTIETWRKMKEEDPERYAKLCLNRSLALKGKPKSEQHKAVLSKLASQRVGEKNPFYGKHFSDQSKEKLRESKAKNLSQINAYYLDTGLLWKTFRFTTEAAEELGLGDTARVRIACVCKSKKGHAYGYIWRYQDDVNTDVLPQAVVSAENRPPRAKAVGQYSLAGELVAYWESAAAYSKTVADEYDSQRKIAKRVSAVCTGRQDSYNNYIWKFIDD